MASEDDSSYPGAFFIQSSSALDSALFFVLAAFILNVIVVILAFCYFDPSPYQTPLVSRTYHTLRRLSRPRDNNVRMTIKSPDGSPTPSTVLFV
ncbi:unnamed protein product [Auanema sp. JU1783]|nr:unnamed protein product [Auanema sp. JU1783]